MTLGSHHHFMTALIRRSSTFLNCHVAEVVRIGLDAADGKDLEIFSPSIGTPPFGRSLHDAVDLHALPRLLGDGTHLYDVAGGSMRKLQNLVGDDPNAATNLRFRTTYEN